MYEMTSSSNNNLNNNNNNSNNNLNINLNNNNLNNNNNNNNLNNTNTKINYNANNPFGDIINNFNNSNSVKNVPIITPSLTSCQSFGERVIFLRKNLKSLTEKVEVRSSFIFYSFVYFYLF